MSLVQAPALGIERFAAGQRKEHRPHASNDDLNAIIRAKPSSSKGTYLKGISMASSMSPGIAIDTKAFVH